MTSIIIAALMVTNLAIDMCNVHKKYQRKYIYISLRKRMKQASDRFAVKADKEKKIADSLCWSQNYKDG